MNGDVNNTLQRLSQLTMCELLDRRKPLLIIPNGRHGSSFSTKCRTLSMLTRATRFINTVPLEWDLISVLISHATLNWVCYQACQHVVSCLLTS